MTISIKPTASGSTIEQDGSTILTVDGSGNISTPNTFTSSNLPTIYEEGTWTPTYQITTDGSDLTINTYDHQNGRYVRIGNYVTAMIDISTSGTTGVGTPSGNLAVSLPFPCASDAGDFGSGLGFSYRFSGDDPKGLRIAQGESQVRLYRIDPATTELDVSVLATAILNSSLTGTYHWIIGQITYKIAE